MMWCTKRGNRFESGWVGLAVGLLALSPAWADSPPKVTGSLETVDGLRVLKLWGTPEQRGFAHGYLLGADLIDIFADTVTHAYIMDDPADYERRVRGELLDKFRFDPDYRAELEGMLRGIAEARGPQGLWIEQFNRNLDLRDLLAVNTLADWSPFVCSSFSAWGEATKDGGMVTARNLDFWATRGIATTHVAIAYVEPGEGRQPWLTVGWPGLIGAYTAMNAEGVTISMHDSSPQKPTVDRGYVPRSLALRQAIETARAATGIEDARRVLTQCPAMMGNNIHVSLPYTGQAEPAAVLEYDGNQAQDGGVTKRVSDATPISCWLVCTNHYCRRAKPRPAGDHPFDSVKRYDYLAEELKSLRETEHKLTLPLARRTIAKAIMESSELLTVHTVFFFPNRSEMHVCVSQRGLAATRSAPIALRLSAVLKR